MKGFPKNAALKSGSFFVRKSGGLQVVTWSAARVGPLSLISPARAKSRERSVATPTRRKQGTCCRLPAAGKRPPRHNQKASAKEHRPKAPRPQPLAAIPGSKAGRKTEKWVRKAGPFWGSENGTDFGVTAYAQSASRGLLFARSSTRDRILVPQGSKGVGPVLGP